jgi:hypothetical protein
MFHLTIATAKRNTNSMLTESFIQSGEDMKDLRAELDKLRKEIESTEDN